MSFSRKLELFEEALHSPEVMAVRARHRDWARNHPPGEVDANEVVRELRLAVVEYFSHSKQLELGEEIAKSLILLRHRHEPWRFAVSMREAVLPSGEEETGDWERADADPEG